jgi:hypothetical protein
MNGIGKYGDGFYGMLNIFIMILHKVLETYGNGSQSFGKTVIGMTILFLKF